MSKAHQVVRSGLSLQGLQTFVICP